jgi:hypothetical protein
MRHEAYRAIAHNFAHSLACGVSLSTGFYELDVYGDAATSPGGKLRLDLLNGKVLEGEANKDLQTALARIPPLFAEGCRRSGGSLTDLRCAEATFSRSGSEEGFVLEIEDSKGQRSATDYSGSESKRTRDLDRHGQLARRPART